VRIILVLSLLALTTPIRALAQPIAPPEQTGNSRYSVCQTIEAAAQENKLPVDFFTRVIWQESHFRADVVGPLTRTGEHAQGIAQFMPGTAAERDLHEPFNPAEALPKSAEFLAELRTQFGNLGLAAAAYNAGPQRVRDFLDGSRDLPAETRNYVFAITGYPIEEWKAPVVQGPNGVNPGDRRTDGSAVNCRDVLAQLERASNSLVVGWQQRNVPSWCRGLQHPNVSVCGPVHLAALVIKSAGAVSPRSHVHLPAASPRRQVSTSVNYQGK
jgi:transglycosylase-like protein with SLT domain